MALRLALRRLAATPAFTAGAIAVLALGTGATLAVFTVMNALVLRPLRVSDPGSLVAIAVQSARGDSRAMPPRVYGELAQRQRSFGRMAGSLGTAVVSAAAGGTVHQAVVEGVTADYFGLLGVPVAQGRVIGPTDDHAEGADADAVCVISDGYWRRIYGAAEDVVGRPLTLGEATVTVIGILAPGFTGIDVGVRTDVIVPAPTVGRIIGLPPDSVPMRHVIARLAPGHTVDAARAELTTIWPSVQNSTSTAAQSTELGEQRLVVSRGATGVSSWRARYEDSLRIVMTASAWLVVIACANLAGLQLARSLRRSRDDAIARALGATPWDLLWPTALEAMVLSSIGGLLGLPLAEWGARLATSLLSTGPVTLELDLALDWGTWSLVALLVGATTFLAGLVPAWLASRRDDGPAPASRVVLGTGPVGSALVVGQVALAVVLLSGAALAVSVLAQLSLRDYGFDSEGVVAAQLMNRPGGYTALDDATYYQSLVERVQSLPGVAAVALVKPMPGVSGPPAREPVTATQQSAASDAAVVVASPGYFDVLKVAVVSGREFSWRDGQEAQAVAMVSKTLAASLFAGGRAIGQRVDVGTRPQHRDLEIIGIVDDASVLNVRDIEPRVVYLSALQQPPPSARWPGLLVRVNATTARASESIARAVEELGHEFVSRTDSLTGQVTRSLARERLLATMAVVYGALAVAMVAIGLWALLAHDVTRRLREMGVRMSLGASPVDLCRGVLARALLLTAIGVSIGAATAWALARSLAASTAIGGSVASSASIAIVATLLLAIAAVAAWEPARRAARTDPMDALRAE